MCIHVPCQCFATAFGVLSWSGGVRASCAPEPLGHNIKYHECISNMFCGMHYAISSVLGERILFGIMHIIHGV